ncbi:MAG: hypothetical protein ABJK39_04370 [Hyphomicrobiales bacterium]
MKKIKTNNWVAAALLGAGIGLIQGAPAMAQLQVQIGGSSGQAKRALINNGYDQIDVYHQGVKSFRARACKNGVHYDVKLNRRGVLKGQNKIGRCQSFLSSQAVEKRLLKQGYTRLSIDEQNGYYVAVGCDARGTRVRLAVNQFGKIERQRKFGQCEPIFDPSDIRPILRRAGYDRIIFRDRQLPWYVAHACRNNQRLELLLTRRGEVRRERGLGRCASPLKPSQLEAHLAKNGYKNIYVFDRKLPGYGAEACQNRQLYDLKLNQFGEIKQRTALGRCAPPVLSEKDARSTLQKAGYKRIELAALGGQRGGFNAKACKDGRNQAFYVTPFGELNKAKDLGACRSHSVLEIKNRLQRRGVSGTKFYSEGCYRGTKFRFHFDDYGDRTRGQRLGSC